MLSNVNVNNVDANVYDYPAQRRQAYVDAYILAAWATQRRTPRMSGEEASREVAKRFPGIKISGETIRQAEYGVAPAPPGRQKR